VPCVARGHVSTAPAQLRLEGAVSQAGRELDTARRLRSGEVPAPEVGGGMETGNRRLQALLCGADTPLPASVISDREKIASEFCRSRSGKSGSSPCGAALLRARQLRAASASWLCLAL